MGVFLQVCLLPGSRRIRVESGCSAVRIGHDWRMQEHPNDPLHGVTLEKVLRAMVELHGWPALAESIPVRCFMFDPTIKSSLTFLRKTPWARKRLEDWYVHDARRGAL